MKKVSSFMTNIRNMGQGVLLNTASSSSANDFESREDAVSQASYRSEEVDPNQSLLSYVEHANEKSAIGENNLKLNIVANTLLLLANVGLF